MNAMTDVQWDRYRVNLEGRSVVWLGWVSDVKEQWFGGYKVLVDMDPPGSVSVQDVYLKDVPESVALSLEKDQQRTITGARVLESLRALVRECNLDKPPS